MHDVWTELHKNYKQQDWIDKPSLFAETAIRYFPKTGKILELGAGQGQDGRFFAEHGYKVTSTDVEESALALAAEKLPKNLQGVVQLQKVDLRDDLPFTAGSFDVVYAHLSLHYFDHDHMAKIFYEAERVLKPGGVFAFFVNSIHDPEYGAGTQLEPDFFQIGKTTKRYFSVGTARQFARYFEVNLLDDHGETYKDAAKGVHNLIRFVGTKPRERKPFTSAVPCAGAIIERQRDGETEVLVQTRWQPSGEAKYNGTIEFPIGRLDKPFEEIFDTVAREVREECGLTLKAFRGAPRQQIKKPQGDDAVVGFRPFCCTQQLKAGKPWISFIFICEVEDGEPKAQPGETKDVRWMKTSELRQIVQNSPGEIFSLELPAWEYYFAEIGTNS